MFVVEKSKSAAELQKDGAILSEMLEIVEQRDSLRNMLEEDRQRWAHFLNLIDWADGSRCCEAADLELGESIDIRNEFLDIDIEDIRSVYEKCQYYLDNCESHCDHCESVEDVQSDIESEPSLCSRDAELIHSGVCSFDDVFRDEGCLLDGQSCDNIALSSSSHVGDSFDYVENVPVLEGLVEKSDVWGFGVKTTPVDDVDLKSVALIDPEDLEEFDQLVGSISDGSEDLGLSVSSNQLNDSVSDWRSQGRGSPAGLPGFDSSSVKFWDHNDHSPNFAEFDGSSDQLDELVSGRRSCYQKSPADPRPGDGEAEPVCDTVTGAPELYLYMSNERRSNQVNREKSQYLSEKIQVFAELERCTRQFQVAKKKQKDWGSLGVKFENRGAVRDLVSMWEYNHVQQSGRQAPPQQASRRQSIVKLQDPPEEESKVDGASIVCNDSGEPNKLLRKKRRKKKLGDDYSPTNVIIEEILATRDENNGSGFPYWLAFVCLFVFSISMIPAMLDCWD